MAEGGAVESWPVDSFQRYAHFWRTTGLPSVFAADVHLSSWPSPIESSPFKLSPGPRDPRSLELHKFGFDDIAINATVQLPHLTSLSFSSMGGSYTPVTLPTLLDAPRLREIRLEGISIADWRTCLPLSRITTLRLHHQDSLPTWYVLVLPRRDVLRFSFFTG
ncbi:hypothetical protein FB45DRAFT_1061039 [Roridomyces roridus]|uniref:Uncharacterized protein n=1 Tax=Roridomyces roridus TaxID=1738132 RepID=A0AAD7BMN0_9AGAR|nr:hypothetical protein FB45DRAFT_1061039 [Roridomyces roridus]